MPSSNPILFPYKLLQGRWSPMLSAAIRCGELWRPIELYVDSGAAYTILRADFAEAAQFDYPSGRKVLVQVGDGVFIPVFLHDLPMQIGGIQFTAPIGFSAKLGVPFNLPGRLGVFEHFRISFDQRRKMVSFQPLPNW
jgi:hypothetical protein